MWAVWITVSAAVLAVLAVCFRLLPAFRSASLGQRLLSASGIALSAGGLNFVLRFWEPTAGPYRADELYPYGSRVNAWAVSFGFTWLAFGLLFVGLALLGSRNNNRLVWATLLASWLLCWLPHGVIGLAFAWAGHNAPSLAKYRAFASHRVALFLANALIMLAHFGLSLSGFVLWGRELWRGRADPSPPPRGRIT